MWRARVAAAEADAIDEACGRCVARCPASGDCRSGCETIFGTMALREREANVREREVGLEAREAALHNRESAWGKLQEKGEHGPRLRTRERFDHAADYKHHDVFQLNGLEGFINRGEGEDGNTMFHVRPTVVDGVRCSWRRGERYHHYSCPDLFVKGVKYHFMGAYCSDPSSVDISRPRRKCNFGRTNKKPDAIHREHQQLEEPIVRAINRGVIPRE
eukprot:TRINITY_DN707_c0_g3_i1.p2 TRINITY_DN707_c0_g3~~TRINITY_DN707_c0_g3_i1.p2  ORF type:complete len:246 (+),score=52.41 TRINITY_DN707_c0_g3_i1:89-739(+)